MHSLALARLKGKSYSIRQGTFFQSCCVLVVVRFDSNGLFFFFEFSPTNTHFTMSIVSICFNLQSMGK